MKKIINCLMCGILSAGFFEVEASSSVQVSGISHTPAMSYADYYIKNCWEVGEFAPLYAKFKEVKHFIETFKRILFSVRCNYLQMYETMGKIVNLIKEIESTGIKLSNLQLYCIHWVLTECVLLHISNLFPLEKITLDALNRVQRDTSSTKSILDDFSKYGVTNFHIDCTFDLYKMILEIYQTGSSHEGVIVKGSDEAWYINTGMFPKMKSLIGDLFYIPRNLSDLVKTPVTLPAPSTSDFKAPDHQPHVSSSAPPAPASYPPAYLPPSGYSAGQPAPAALSYSASPPSAYLPSQSYTPPTPWFSLLPGYPAYPAMQPHDASSSQVLPLAPSGLPPHSYPSAPSAYQPPQPHPDGYPVHPVAQPSAPTPSLLPRAPVPLDVQKLFRSSGIYAIVEGLVQSLIDIPVDSKGELIRRVDPIVLKGRFGEALKKNPSLNQYFSYIPSLFNQKLNEKFAHYRKIKAPKNEALYNEEGEALLREISGF